MIELTPPRVAVGPGNPSGASIHDDGDLGDRLNLHRLSEDPVRWEAMIRSEIERGRTNPEAKALVESIYCDEDRDAAFTRFRSGLEFAQICHVLETFGTSREHTICEIGGGGGWLGWALHCEGYSVEMLEPNSQFISGTGYLRTRPDAANIRIWNDLSAWYADPHRFDAILTHNCCHHFPGLVFAAASIRRKVCPGGRWYMLREAFADTSRELFRELAGHPYSQKYGLYECYYPASYYVEALELAGFSLEAVIPARYANGVLANEPMGPESPKNRAATAGLDMMLRQTPALTARLFRAEVFANRYLGRTFRYFTRPQALVFKRRELEA